MSKLRKNSATYDGWIGGINEGSDSFVIEDEEFASAENVDVELFGVVKCRRRQEIYTDMTNSVSEAKSPIYQLYRYTNSTNSMRRIIAYSADQVLTADLGDDANFQYISGALGTSTLNSRTRFCGIGQYRDTIYFSTDYDKVIAYNPVEGGTTVRECNLSGLTDMPSNCIYADTQTRGGTLEQNTTYTYGFTVIVKLGNNELAETNPLQSTEEEFSQPQYRWVEYPYCRTYFQTGEVAEERACRLRKGVLKSAADLPDNAYKVVVYRDLGVPNSEFQEDAFNLKSDVKLMYRLGTFLAEDFNNAEIGWPLFWDLGDDPSTTDVIQYTWLEVPPPSRFLAYHKSRMWYGYTTLNDANTGSPTLYPSRLFYSEFQKPENVKDDSFIDISSNDGDEITGVVSWKNKALLVFKNNSMWAVLGGDKEIVVEQPDLRVEAIDHAVGCVAPHSIAFVEGAVVWLSNRGPFFYDGSFPQPLKADNVRKMINRIQPSKLYNAYGVSNSNFRAYYLSLCDPSVEPAPAVNNTVLKWDIETLSWTRHKRSSVGVGAFVENYRGDQEFRLLAGVDADQTTIDNQGSIVLYDYKESGKDIGVNAAETDIAWAFQTKFYDCGREDIDKNFHSVSVQYVSSTDITLDFIVDNHYNSVVDSNSKTLPASAPDYGELWTADSDGMAPWDEPRWGEFRWAAVSHREYTVKLDSNAFGNRISFLFSGTTGTVRPEIQRITVYFDPKERTR